EERLARQKGAFFILQICSSLKIQAPTVALACTFFQRFYMRESFKHHSNYDIAATCLYIAWKISEKDSHVTLFKMIIATARKAQKNENLQISERSLEYWKWRRTILDKEPLVLATLCFDTEVKDVFQGLCDTCCAL
ncbi:cyclin-like protein, partial [Blyttiomyces helicus]